MQSNKKLCEYSFDILIGTLKKISADKIIFPSEFKDKEFPLFVTWYTGKNKDLRGCIGTFEKDNLEKNLAEYTLISAFKDKRFKPIILEEVKDLTCSVSLLTDFETASDAYDWNVGENGITIEFKDKNGYPYRGTFLPEVAAERGWSKDKTLEHLINKAGKTIN